MKYLIIAAIALSGAASAQTKKTTKKENKQTESRETETRTESRSSETRSSGGTSFERQYGLAGCGLGSVVMGKHGGQVSAATTNGTLGNQTFAITAGTLNCLDPKTAEVASRMDQFIIVNHSQLQGDIARGNGESITAISSIMGCSQSASEIGQSLKANYSTLFSAEKYTNEITDGIINVILSNPELSSKCNKLAV